MSKVERSDIVDYQTWTDRRSSEQKTILPIKEARRIHVGEYLTFLFENAETIRYQIQEMMRVERIVREKDIVHEIETYNDVLGDPGELGCTLLIEVETPEERAELLTKWLDLPKHLYAELEDGTKVRPAYDLAQVGDTRVSSVQYLKFPLDGQTPVALGADHPELTVREELTDSQRAALTEDLQAS